MTQLNHTHVDGGDVPVHVGVAANDKSTHLETEPSESAGLVLQLSPSSICRRLVVLVLFLALFGAAANLVIYQIAPTPDHRIARLFYRIDLGHEPSIPAWYSSIALLVSSLLLTMIAVFKRRGGQPFVFHWFGLAALFFLMALDEAVMFHEMVNNALHQLLNTGGVFYFAWVIPAGLFAVAMAIGYARFLGHLQPRTRWLFMLAGAIFVGGAVGMEMVAGVIHESYGLESVAHTISQTIEETCEMLGIVLFIYALLDFIDRNIGSIRLQAAPAE